MKVPSSSSLIAWRNCSWVFITIGPYHATGSASGLPDTSRNRMPCSPACTTTSSPRSNTTSERFPVSSRTVVSRPGSPRSVSTPKGAEASRKLPLPSNT